MKKLILSTAAVLAVIVLLPLIYIGTVLLRSTGGLPVWDGEHSLTGLDGTIEVLRDENAVPHVFAQSERDAFFAQGFLHAQDRLWQMMSARQALSGRMAEWFGAGALGGDRFNRINHAPRAIQRDFEQLPADDRVLLEAYAAGVNAYLDSDAYRRPPEMVLLHIKPERWQAMDSLIVYRGVYNTLLGYGNEPLTQRLRLHAADERAAELSGLRPFEVRPIVEEAPAVSAVMAPIKQRSFSDSWLLSGEHTTSGMPLLANDPQLPSTLPNFWYLTHLSIAGENRVGASLPGLPSIAVGRTDHIAWGITAGNVDQADLALVHGDPDDATRYRRTANGAWQRLSGRDEVFQVRFGDEYKERILATEEGGTIIPSNQIRPAFSEDPDALVELKIVHFEGDTSLSAFFALNRARNTAQALDALSRFTGPSLNFIIADVDGEIGYVSAGRYAERQGDAGQIIDFGPADGSTWSPIPYADNPQTIGPGSGRIVAANQQQVGDSYPSYLSDAWADPHRAMRIHALLDQQGKHDVDSFLAMQRDTFLEPASRTVPKMLEVERDALTDVEREMLEVLQEWDYRFDNDSAGPTVFITWMRFFHEELAADELGPSMWPGMRRSALPAIALAVLGGQNTQWCAQAGEDSAPDCSEVLRGSLSRAAEALATRLGESPDDWRWGGATPMTHPHQGFAGLPLLGSRFSRVATYPGGPDTLMIKSIDASNAPDFSRADFTSSLQVVFDLSNLEASRFMLSTGQSGHYRSPHYDDFLPRFAAGERFTIPTERGAIQAKHTLLLSPAD
ncbi:MAG: penicillin acylase family protein [Pseudomonadota bacterium]